jgi:type III secretion protein R
VSGLPNPVTLIVLLAGVAVIPFVAIMCTTYVKLVVVLGLVRNALGVQTIPPNLALNGIAIVLSVYIMAPIARASFDAVKDNPPNISDLTEVSNAVQAAAEPFRKFLQQQTVARERIFFLGAAHRLWPPQQAEALTENDFLVLVPAFTTSELTEAFKIGFLLFLPFVVIDLVVSNILLAMGMMMVSPMTISLPFKLFLFVVVDGWQKLIEGLVLSYGTNPSP